MSLSILLKQLISASGLHSV